MSRRGVAVCCVLDHNGHIPLMVEWPRPEEEDEETENNNIVEMKFFAFIRTNYS